MIMKTLEFKLKKKSQKMMLKCLIYLLENLIPLYNYRKMKKLIKKQL